MMILWWFYDDSMMILWWFYDDCTCCGASPMLMREVANAIEREVPASRFNENMSNHFMYGTNKRIPSHSKKYGPYA